MRYVAKVLSIERRCKTMFGRFNRRPGDSPEEANWEGWTPPWMSGEGRGPRGPFGFGRGFGGPRGPFGFGHGWHGPRGHSAQASVLAGSGACPMKFWHYVL